MKDHHIMTHNLATVASRLSVEWESTTRPNGDEIRTVKDGEHKQLITDIVHACHDALGGCLPNDWVYASVESAIDAMVGLDERYADEASCEFSDANVDVYNYDRKQWLFNPFADDYMTRAMNEMGQPDDFYQQIAFAQYLALRDIFATTLAWLQETAEEWSEEETEDAA